MEEQPIPPLTVEPVAQWWLPENHPTQVMGQQTAAMQESHPVVNPLEPSPPEDMAKKKVVEVAMDGAKATVEVGATRSQRRYLRLGVQHVAIGRQPLPVSMLGLVPSLADQGLLRWRMPESVEQLTITPGAVVIRTSS